MTSVTTPVVVVGDQHVLAELFVFQPLTGGGVDGPGQPQVFGVSPVSCQRTTRRTQGLWVIWAISASTFCRGRRVSGAERAVAAVLDQSMVDAVSRIVDAHRAVERIPR